MSKYFNSIREEINLLYDNKYKENIYDIYHLDRVYKMARYINYKESLEIDENILCLSCYMYRLNLFFKNINDKNEYINKIFDKLNLNDNIINKVKECIEYKDIKNLSVESKVLKDAVNLDKLGAIGIGRAFIMGAYKEESLYNPNIELESYKDREIEKSSSTIHYIYEKLMKLEEDMETDIGRTIARKRINYMEEYLNKFFEEFEVIL
ncbi:uncharacterized protein J2Z53_000593 [Clostridium moniliforme]|uniref:Phosphohydrolase n=1 Tax=Clostridium moniliforme TaxID=39489 RepID=A0ABS4EYE9_9CLOT|nr:hypothetical protein [Clostridium moniliforme]MBP1889014.1 uncharacterized protein [Clostridium moniliforme]